MAVSRDEASRVVRASRIAAAFGRKPLPPEARPDFLGKALGSRGRRSPPHLRLLYVNVFSWDGALKSAYSGVPPDWGLVTGTSTPQPAEGS